MEYIIDIEKGFTQAPLDGVAINEIEFYDENSIKIPASSINQIDCYDSGTKGLPSYWNGIGWGGANLFDEITSYSSSSSTFLLYPDASLNFARIYVKLAQKVSTIKIYYGGNVERTPKHIKAYKVIHYNKIEQLNLRNNQGLSLIGAVENSNGSSTLIVNEFKVTKNIYLVKARGIFYTALNGEWVNTELIEPLTKADFETHGMDDISTITNEQWLALEGDEFEIIAWTDDTEPKFLEITTDPFSPLEKLNQEDAFEVLAFSDKYEIKTKQDGGVSEPIDNGKLFKTTLNDFANILGVETL